MKDLFQDEKFERFLVGGVHDLDEDIGCLVYTLFKSRLVETIGSCSGHIDANLLNVGVSSRPETHYVYHERVLCFNVPNSGKSGSFLDRARSFVAQRDFASYGYLDGRSSHSITLEMKDLSDNLFSEEASKRLGLLYRPEREVRISLATKRYAEFVQFWKDLNALAKQV